MIQSLLESAPSEVNKVLDNVEDLEELKSELVARLGELIEKKQDIADQLSQARVKRNTDGIYSDPDWYRKATHAMNCAGRETQKIQHLLGAVNRKQKQRNIKKSGDTFRLAAEIVLDPELLEEVVDLAIKLDGENS